MASAILYCVILAAVAAAFSAATETRIGRNFLPAICFTGLITVFLSAFEAAAAIPYVFLILGVLSAAATAVLLGLNKEKRKYVCSVEAVIFLFAAAFFLLMNWGRVFILNDEFSHWGLAVKNLFLLGKLPASPETNSLYPSYPPFATAICYLGTCFAKNFCEGAAFVPMDLLLLSGTMSGLSLFYEKCGKNRVRDLGVALTGVGIGALAFGILCFKLSAFSVIAVDTAMGLMGTYLVFEMLQKAPADEVRGRSGRGEIFSKIWNPAIVAGALALTKDVAIAFVIFAGIVGIVLLFAEKSCLKNRLSSLSAIALSVITAVGMKSFWSVVKRSYGIAEEESTGILYTLKKIGAEGFTDVQKETTGAYFRAWLAPVISVGVPLAAVLAVLILGSAAVVGMTAKLKREDFGRVHCVLGSVTVTFFGYALGVLVSYWAKFTAEEAKAVASFERYLGSYLTYWMLVLILCALAYPAAELLRRAARGKGTVRRKIRMICKTVSCVILVGIVGFFTLFYPYRTEKAEEMREADRAKTERLQALLSDAAIEDNAGVLAVWQEADNRTWLAANYELAPRKLVNPENWQERLAQKDADYVIFLFEEAEKIPREAAELLGTEPEPCVFYPVKK